MIESANGFNTVRKSLMDASSLESEPIHTLVDLVTALIECARDDRKNHPESELFRPRD